MWWMQHEALLVFTCCLKSFLFHFSFSVCLVYSTGFLTLTSDKLDIFNIWHKNSLVSFWNFRLQNVFQAVAASLFVRLRCYDSPGSAVVQVSSLGSWNCVGFLSMAAAINSWNGLLRRRGVGAESAAPSSSALWISSSGSADSSSTSFCSSEGVGVDEVLEVGVPGRLLGLLLVLRSNRRTWATRKPGPAAPAPGGKPSSRSGPALSSNSTAGDAERFEGRSSRPLVCSDFCSLFWVQQRHKKKKSPVQVTNTQFSALPHKKTRLTFFRTLQRWHIHSPGGSISSLRGGLLW